MVPTAFSGSRPEARQDAECLHFMMQAKATGFQHIIIQREDIESLFNDAAIAHKLPIFGLQLLAPPMDGGNIELIAIPVQYLANFALAWQMHMRECSTPSEEGRKTEEG